MEGEKSEGEGGDRRATPVSEGGDKLGVKRGRQDTKRDKPKHVNATYTELAVKYFTITNTHLGFLGFSSGIGSVAIYAALSTRKEYLELMKNVPVNVPVPDNVEFLGDSWKLWFAVALVSYLVFFGTVLRVKWNNGQRWFDLIF
jgi:hypothetical protein